MTIVTGEDNLGPGEAGHGRRGHVSHVHGVHVRVSPLHWRRHRAPARSRRESFAVWTVRSSAGECRIALGWRTIAWPAWSGRRLRVHELAIGHHRWGVDARRRCVGKETLNVVARDDLHKVTCFHMMHLDESRLERDNIWIV